MSSVPGSDISSVPGKSVPQEDFQKLAWAMRYIVGEQLAQEGKDMARLFDPQFHVVLISDHCGRCEAFGAFVLQEARERLRCRQT